MKYSASSQSSWMRKQNKKNIRKTFSLPWTFHFSFVCVFFPVVLYRISSVCREQWIETVDKTKNDKIHDHSRYRIVCFIHVDDSKTNDLCVFRYIERNCVLLWVCVMNWSNNCRIKMKNDSVQLHEPHICTEDKSYVTRQ